MPAYTQIIREMSEAKFQKSLGFLFEKLVRLTLHAIISRLPRREENHFALAQKNEARVVALFAHLKTVDDDQMVEEILRTWLLSRRDILGAALDYLEIPHDNGLTESDDVDKLSSLSVDELKPLVKALSETASTDDIQIYLRFMGAENVSDALTGLDQSHSQWRCSPPYNPRLKSRAISLSRCGQRRGYGRGCPEMYHG